MVKIILIKLISVSPFDNTFIFASKPNFQDSFFNQGANNNEKNWAGFFIGKTFRTSNVVRPFLSEMLLDQIFPLVLVLLIQLWHLLKDCMRMDLLLIWDLL